MASTPERQMRRRILTLTPAAAVMAAVGALFGWWWLLGVGVWVLIAAFLIEMIYRP
ncbi:hypothetical protein [Streptomyces sp. NPDC058613]|uniref:hypothetical protein n=1 Tax=unclassified Streptomyces TaxID=2593676 RepID=UPI00364CC75B